MASCVALVECEDELGERRLEKWFGIRTGGLTGSALEFGCYPVGKGESLWSSRWGETLSLVILMWRMGGV